MSAAPAPVDIRLEWTPALLREVLVAAQGAPASRSKKAFLGVVFGLACGFLGYSAILSGNVIVLFPLAIFAAIFALRWWTVVRWVEGEMKSRLRRGSTKVTLGEDGIDSVHPLSSSHFEWELVLDVCEGKQALHLMLTPAMSLPIPDASLPEGVTRDDLRARVEAWRAGGVFA